MDLNTLFEDPSKKAKARAAEIGAALVEGRLPAGRLADFANRHGGTTKATCLEGLESATRTNPDLVSPTLFDFVKDSLDDDEPRIKWEAAKVIGNVAGTILDPMEGAVEGLLRNASHEGTVVRWASAFALGEIVLHNDGLGRRLLPKLQGLNDQEEDVGVKKKYARALKRS